MSNSISPTDLDGEPPLSADQAASLIGQLRDNVEKALLGKVEAVRLAVITLIAGGHLLVEDVPGVGKTSLAKSLARSLNARFTRLQFTPDMLPSDIVGSSVFLPNLGEFEFRRGPIFTNILLADEINRTTPRTQSALLEAMEEQQVSVEGTTYPLEAPFFVVATQNPFEFEGTYPLPENQLDRFMICMSIGYPSRQVERTVLRKHRDGQPFERLDAVMDGAKVRGLQRLARQVELEDSLSDYLLTIVDQTRSHDQLELGVSTRGAITFSRACQALALIEGRNYVIPDDIKTLAVPVLAHRVVYRGVIREGLRDRAQEVIRQILGDVPVPN